MKFINNWQYNIIIVIMFWIEARRFDRNSSVHSPKNFNFWNFTIRVTKHIHFAGRTYSSQLCLDLPRSREPVLRFDIKKWFKHKKKRLFSTVRCDFLNEKGNRLTSFKCTTPYFCKQILCFCSTAQFLVKLFYLYAW